MSGAAGDDHAPIALVSHHGELEGGAVRTLVDLAIGLKARGVELVVVTPAPGSLQEDLEARGIETAVVRKFGDPRRPMFDRARPVSMQNLNNAAQRAAYVGRLRSYLSRRKVGLVHVNTLIGSSAALAAKAAGLPVVWHVHEGRLLQRRGWGVRLRLLRTLADQVVVPSEYVSGMLLRAGVDRDRLTVVHNGVDSEAVGVAAAGRAAMRRQLGIPARAIVAGAIGQVAPIKGTDLFVEVCRLVAADAPEHVHFALVGGPGHVEFEPYARGVFDQIERAGLGDRFTITGPREDALACLGAIDILLVTSRDETFGLVALEAMAADVPVVAFDVGALGENIVDGETGHLVQAGDVISMADRVTALVRSPGRRDSTIKAAVEFVRRERSLDGYVDGVWAAHAAAVDRILRLQR